MHTITSIQQAKKRESRVNLYLDDQFWIGIDKNDLLKFNLFRGKTFESDEKQLIEKTASFNKVFEKAMNYTMVRPRSIREMRDYLIIKRGLTKEESQEMINKLIEREFLSDEKFTQWYVENRLSFGVHGENKIKAELAKKGITGEIMKSVLRENMTEEFQVTQIVKIKEYAEKAFRTIKFKSPIDKKQKLIARLASRGFKYEDIQKALREML